MDGGQLAAKSRMIVVTLNYRLGILGINTTIVSYIFRGRLFPSSFPSDQWNAVDGQNLVRIINAAT